MKENLTIVKTRKDFVDAFRQVFIPSCNKMGISFDYGKAINTWTTFWVWVDKDTFMVVELQEDERLQNN